MSFSSNQAAIASSDKVLAASLAVLSTFILGYSATRVVLNLASSSTAQDQPEAVIPHQAAGWAALGNHSFD